MDRRALLTAVGGSVAGGSVVALSGCVGETDTGPATNGSDDGSGDDDGEGSNDGGTTPSLDVEPIESALASSSEALA